MPRLTDDSLAAFYDNEYQLLYTGAGEAPDTYLKGQRIRGTNISQSVAGSLPVGSYVVDIGCGAGWALLPFREEGHRVAGCDLGGTFLEAGRAQGLDLRHGDHTTLTDIGPFDLVILSHVFEHLTDPRKLMDDIKPMLAPSGLVYVEVPGPQRISTDFGDPRRYFQNAHLWNFDLGSLTATMAGFGYRQVKGNEFIRSLFIPDDAVAPADRGGYDRAVKTLSRAEAVRPFYEGRRKAKAVARRTLGAERASKLRRIAVSVRGN
ncbi:MAG: class I SAM-dependent methyltransferase [Mycolicibacterium sp.]|uniref:class I SAM-dependent methyltransferase n=1 Tax=Mycolicibacterium sp. TaxID=2320850 RepID=UPI003D131D1A